jgi:hypothetical protein
MNHARRLPTSDREKNMKIHRIQTETLGYCQGCHNRALVEITFSSLALRCDCANAMRGIWSRTFRHG